MKLTHTLCAAFLFGVLSTSAFAQENAKPRSNKPVSAIAAEAEAPQGKAKAKQPKMRKNGLKVKANASARPDCAVAISAKGGQGPATPAEGCGKEKRAAAKKPCINAKGLKCSKEERAAAYMKIADIKGESAVAKKPCKNAKGVKCPKTAKADMFLKIDDIKGESKD